MEIIGHTLSLSRLGKLTENIFDEYPIYEFNIPSIIIDNYLPDKLYRFTSINCKTLIKRYLFYSKLGVISTRFQLKNNNIKQLSNSISLNTFLKELLKTNDSTIRYNFVITDDSILFIQVPTVRHVSYYMLCKHITLSNRAEYVRFAGEIWSDDDNYNCLLLNNSSGSYRPPDPLIIPVIKLFNYFIPDLEINGITFRISSLPSIKHRLNKKVKRKLAIQSDQHLI